MKLKYYLRGLGIGIVGTALILSIAMSGAKESLNDSEIIAKAESLGMVKEENMTLSVKPADSEDEPSNEIKMTDDLEDSDATSADALPANDSAEKNSSLDKSNAEEELRQKEESAGIKNQAASEKEQGNADNTANAANAVKEPIVSTANQKDEAAAEASKEASQDIIFTISKGNTSDTICKALESKGVIDNAKDFDAYLCSTGMDIKLADGEHTVKQGLSYEEIAKIITSR